MVASGTHVSDVFLGFLSAVAFATILAVVSGLALAGASAISHDLYARVIKKGTASEAAEIRVSKIATICLGFVAIILGILLFQDICVVPMMTLVPALAAPGAGQALTILLAPRFEDLPEFLAAHEVEVVCSLPHYRKPSTDRQRGEGLQGAVSS